MGKQEDLDRKAIKSKIPESAKLVFRGVLWDVYQWQQTMLDGSSETFEGLKRRGSAKVIATHDGKVLINRELRVGDEKSYYTLPGGIIKEGEAPLDAAKRELLEETGMESDDWELFYTLDLLRFPRIDYYIHIFLARNCRKSAGQSLDNGERITVEEVSMDDFLRKLGTSKERMGTAYSLFTDSKWISSLKSRLDIYSKT